LSYRRCHIVGAVAGNDREEIDFQFSGGAMGGIVGENFDNTGANKSQRGRSPRLTVTLEEILTRSNAPTDIDYFSLDVEGAEDIALQAPVLKQYRFKVMTLERPKQSLQDLLVANGYVMLKKLSPFGETLWAHTATLPELDLKGAGIEYTVA
jgi:Methyltransferase FkbM domain